MSGRIARLPSPPTPASAPSFEVRTVRHGPADTEVEVWQLPSPASPQLTAPVRLAGLRADLLRFLPEGDAPARLKTKVGEPKPTAPPSAEPPVPAMDLRRAVWSFIHAAASMPNGGTEVGEATSAVTPWPHQRRAFHRLYDNWPPKLLIADEVGLGKTIQAGMLLRQAWLAGRAKRILILAPKAVLRQWQIELREKFNLNWPIYDGEKLNWYPSPAMRGRHERPVGKSDWHKEPIVIASSHLLRRADRAAEVLTAEPWDLVVLDEAHHARRRGAGSAQEGGPNALLRLMRGMKERTSGLVLLTATPMQVHPVEVFDLLSLLGLPSAWNQSAFLGFFNDINQDSPSQDAFERMAAMFRAVEASYGAVGPNAVQRLGISSGLRATTLAAVLKMDEASLRQRVRRLRTKLAVEFQSHLNATIGDEDIGETKEWSGYRLNPALFHSPELLQTSAMLVDPAIVTTLRPDVTTRQVTPTIPRGSARKMSQLSKR